MSLVALVGVEGFLTLTHTKFTMNFLVGPTMLRGLCKRTWGTLGGALASKGSPVSRETLEVGAE